MSESSLSDTGKPDLELVGALFAVSEFEVSGDGLTLWNDSSDQFELVAE